MTTPSYPPPIAALRKHIIAFVRNAHTRVSAYELDGRTIWLKRHLKSKSRVWHKIQSGLAALFSQPLLRATVSPGGGKAVQTEVKLLKLFAARGINVPAVTLVDDEIMVLEDCGPELRRVLNGEQDPQKREDLILRATGALIGLHAAGLAHGRPLLRNMTLKDDKIYFIDLEEDPLAVMPVADAQARDIWFFLASLEPYDRNGAKLMARAMRRFAEKADPATLAALKRLAAFLRPVRKIVAPLRLDWRDVVGAVRTNEVLEEYFA